MTWLDAQHRRELDKVTKEATMSPDELQALARKICEDWWYDTPKGGEALIAEVWDAFKEVQAATREECAQIADDNRDHDTSYAIRQLGKDSTDET